MRLYFNDDLIHPRPEEGDVLAAFEHLRRSREGGLGFSVALRRPDGVFGVRMAEPFAEHVAGALRDYLWAEA